MRRFVTLDRPILTAMVQAKSIERTKKLIRLGLDGGADAFGIQLERLKTEERTPEKLRELFACTEGKPVYVTCYRSCENEQKSDDKLAEELIAAAECGGALIDVMGDMFDKTPGELTYDAAAVEKQKKLISRIHELGADVLISSHVLKFTPESEVLAMAREQHSRGADFAKIVTAADTVSELCENFKISAELAKLPYMSLFLCGGAQSYRHRRAAPFMSNSMFLCVPERDELATAVQPLLSEAKMLVDIMQKGV